MAEEPPVAVVTGASSGIGQAVALALRRDGYRVRIHGLAPEHIREGFAALERVPGPPPFEPLRADLSLQRDLAAFAQQLREAHPRIDLLVNNAGALFFRRGETAEGVERTWALNVLAPFRLTRELLPALRAAAPARVVNVASRAHQGHRLRPEDPEGRRRYSGYPAYGRSKLALLMLTYEFARREPAGSVAFFAAHPGFVASRFGHNNPGLAGSVVRFLESVAGIRPEEGARTVLYAAESAELNGASGLYASHERIVRSSRASYDTAAAGGLWALCSRQTGLPVDLPRP